MGKELLPPWVLEKVERLTELSAKITGKKNEDVQAELCVILSEMVP